jgi:hypothetical protein
MNFIERAIPSKVCHKSSFSLGDISQDAIWAKNLA